MDNHTHLVLHANLELAKQWSNLEVLKRWSKLGKLSLLCQLYLNRDWRTKLNDVELAIVLGQIDTYRQKLTDISVFISRFNYYIAKRANKEDGVAGHFWEARFKSQALLDSNAVLSCMFYVDLNPIRANKSKTLERSYFTSIKLRLDKAVEQSETKMVALRTSFVESNEYEPISMTLKQYVIHLENLISNKSEDNTFVDLDCFGASNTNWSEDTFEFEMSFSASAGEKELVAFYNKQARLFSGGFGKENQALSETILCRLLDLQCQSGKTHSCS
jgi:hypothetical protein